MGIHLDTHGIRCPKKWTNAVVSLEMPLHPELQKLMSFISHNCYSSSNFFFLNLAIEETTMKDSSATRVALGGMGRKGGGSDLLFGSSAELDNDRAQDGTP